jgi:hypothetical protein
MENRYEYLLERFRTREITPEESAELEEHLKNDPAFAEEFAWQESVAGAWKSLENRKIKTLLQEEEKAFRASGSGNIIRFDFRRWTAVAAAMLAIGAAVWFFIPGSPPNAADFYTAFPDKISYGRGESQAGQEMEAIGLYNARNYAAAAKVFGRLQHTYPDSTVYAFYHGVSLVGALRYPEAIPVLEPVSRQKKYPLYQTNALWYLSLAHTGAGDFPAARRTLQDYLERPDAVAYRSKGVQLLKKLPEK